MHTRTAGYIVFAAVVAVVLLLPFVADAQTVGKAGDAAVQRFADWLSGPFIRPVLTIGFVVAGIAMMCGRHTFEGIVFCIIGASIGVGANNLASVMVGGG